MHSLREHSEATGARTRDQVGAPALALPVAVFQLFRKPRIEQLLIRSIHYVEANDLTDVLNAVNSVRTATATKFAAIGSADAAAPSAPAPASNPTA